MAVSRVGCLWTNSRRITLRSYHLSHHSSQSLSGEKLADFPLATLEEKLNYRFYDRTNLELALTHSSMSTERNNEKLEFLGDRILGRVAAELLFDRFESSKDEGVMTRYFDKLVRRETLVQIAHEIELGPHLRLSLDFEARGGRRNANVLADAVEALLAALHLDHKRASSSSWRFSTSNSDFERPRSSAERSSRRGEYNPAVAFVKEKWAPLLEGLESSSLKDAKSAVQEQLQQRGAMPEYRLISTTGPAHCPEFKVVLRVVVVNSSEDPPTGTGNSRGVCAAGVASVASSSWKREGFTGRGSTKRAAETAAAAEFLMHLTK